MSNYYTSGPRVPHAAPLERHHRWDWQAGAPLPGELEYLGTAHWVHAPGKGFPTQRLGAR